MNHSDDAPVLRAGDLDKHHDRLISMRDGAFVDQTRLSGGTTGELGALAELEA